ncbi:xanthine dehydrogenase family protein molybdopterin-binding subunit [Mesorhizobium sp. LHD-90]|uniref:xanthine dehydrogenase family protein molybdopterin-binding subunit n=1 Tax=Mesorhizobium sp. LHD-90 TaxID=3071414 RepID=UPI0027DEEA4A|nr:xanthine dehydrogenase family protein molybdopterin-binding subunit [Mesorhizobium sp. LHD-90]MDQ6432549.1 xanthine dehydrogenase family protein molybdopterin-binding subunit [Mesorhizobium sp. LHD-90]
MAIGKPVVRVEDERFLRGEGRFTADYTLPFMLEAHILRSPHAHARIGLVGLDEALALKGVHAIFTNVDLPEGLPPIQCRIPTHGDLSPYLQHPLARDTVRYVGEPIAVIVADTRAIAEDAAELIEIEFDPLPAITSPQQATADGAAPIHAPGNLAGRWGFDLGDVAGALKAAAFTASDSFSIQRHSAMPMETRGLLASYDAGRNLLDIYGPTKVVHTNRNMLAAMLGMGEAEIRMIEPDVGGSFGARGEFYPEDYLIPFASIRLKRPVRWIEDRVEHFAAINHSRDCTFDVNVCADKDGIITAFDVKLVTDMGSYIRTHGDVVPSHAAASFPGPYRVRNYRVDAMTVMTNKTPTGTYRAPGMFEANFARERILDRLADKMGIDRAELRSRNLIRPEQMPWHVGTESVKRPTIFDSGDFPLIMDRALQAYGWSAPFEREADGWKRGRGICVLVEPSGLGPFEGVRIEVDQHGKVQIFSGSSNQGQGHETVLAQIASETLTVPMDRIRVRHGDTGIITFGGGTYASRTAIMGGNAVHSASVGVREKALKAVAGKFGIAVEELDLREGAIWHGRKNEPLVTLGGIARMLMPGNQEILTSPSAGNIPDNDGLVVTSYVRGVPSGAAVFAVHMADVLVDPETGETKVERYFVACDVGRQLNPLIVEGQIVGGVVQGLGGAFLEELAYNEDGQLTTGTFADYLMPNVYDAPPITALVFEESPAPTNVLGVKGVGEVGPSGVGATIGNAIANALGAVSGLNKLPLTPERVLHSIGFGGQV